MHVNAGMDLSNLGHEPPKVRVRPANENIRKYIYHPAGKIRFRATCEESVEWPWDAFTQRRVEKSEVILVDRPAVTNQ